MKSALRMYGEGLRPASAADDPPLVRLRDGAAFPLAVSRYLGPADEIDKRLLDGLAGPVLDVGCGPGRHLHALTARGVFALGVDLSPVAVELAIGGGGRAIVGDIFDDLPGSGTWRSALLLDGNIGIGGSPVRLLERLQALLGDLGVLLVELEPPGVPTGPTHARIEHGRHTSAWFPWARVAAGDFAPIARAGGFIVGEPWTMAGRWFAHCHRGDRRPHRSHADAARRSAGLYSVP